MLIHCGDMCNVATAQQMAGFDVVYVNGNMDDSAAAVNDTILQLNPRNTAGITYSDKVGGVRIAATHGHLRDKLEGLIGRRHAFVFHGHTHRRRDELVGKTRVVNPGALGGVRYEPRSVCLVDLDTEAVRFIDVADW